MRGFLSIESIPPKCLYFGLKRLLQQIKAFCSIFKTLGMLPANGIGVDGGIRPGIMVKEPNLKKNAKKLQKGVDCKSIRV